MICEVTLALIAQRGREEGIARSSTNKSLQDRLRMRGARIRRSKDLMIQDLVFATCERQLQEDIACAKEFLQQDSEQTSNTVHTSPESSQPKRAGHSPAPQQQASPAASQNQDRAGAASMQAQAHTRGNTSEARQTLPTEHAKENSASAAAMFTQTQTAPTEPRAPASASSNSASNTHANQQQHNPAGANTRLAQADNLVDAKPGNHAAAHQRSPGCRPTALTQPRSQDGSGKSPRQTGLCGRPASCHVSAS